MKENLQPKRDHAIVIGGSMAGLWTARILTNHFARVTVLERDQLPAEPQHRSGVPQSRHVHTLLSKGLQQLEALFPGLAEELAAEGATSFDWGADIIMFMRGRTAPRRPFAIKGISASRIMLENGVRRRLAADDRVHFVEGTEVIALRTDEEGKRVTGVEIRRRSGAGNKGTSLETLTADWIVDASGRRSRVPQWLQAIGYEAPDEEVVNAFLGYASRRYEKPAGVATDWRVMVQFVNPPNPRSGVIFQEEDGNWMVTLSGTAADYPPVDEEGFLAFARSLEPAFYAAIKDARPLSSIHGYRATENRLRHYEKLSRWPDNFAVIGDAVFAPNPIYGQGMTAAALSAVALDKTLQKARPDLAGAARRYQQQVAKVVAPIWLMATSEDLRFPTTEGARPGQMARILHWYFDRIFQVVPDDPDVAKIFVAVFQLLQPGPALFHPRVLARVFAHPFKSLWKRHTPGRLGTGPEQMVPQDSVSG